jgi:hypothetical protein
LIIATCTSFTAYERQIRPLVIAKKISFGVKSERGARFIERKSTAWY